MQHHSFYWVTRVTAQHLPMHGAAPMKWIHPDCWQPHCCTGRRSRGQSCSYCGPQKTELRPTVTGWPNTSTQMLSTTGASSAEEEKPAHSMSGAPALYFQGSLRFTSYRVSDPHIKREEKTLGQQLFLREL